MVIQVGYFLVGLKQITEEEVVEVLGRVVLMLW